jgi:hypothetical protein
MQTGMTPLRWLAALLLSFDRALELDWEVVDGGCA